jgi:hypothetical protein
VFEQQLWDLAFRLNKCFSAKCRCKKIDAGVYEPLPVAAIQRDATTTRVLVYEYPFVHEQLYAWGAARARLVVRHIVSPRATGALRRPVQCISPSLCVQPWFCGGRVVDYCRLTHCMHENIILTSTVECTRVQCRLQPTT